MEWIAKSDLKWILSSRRKRGIWLELATRERLYITTLRFSRHYRKLNWQFHPFQGLEHHMLGARRESSPCRPATQ